MDLKEAAAVLGIEGPVDDKALRRKYLRKVREHPPERDPEGFQRVREAYDLLASFASVHAQTIALEYESDLGESAEFSEPDADGPIDDPGEHEPQPGPDTQTARTLSVRPHEQLDARDDVSGGPRDLSEATRLIEHGRPSGRWLASQWMLEHGHAARVAPELELLFREHGVELDAWDVMEAIVAAYEHLSPRSVRRWFDAWDESLSREAAHVRVLGGAAAARYALVRSLVELPTSLPRVARRTVGAALAQSDPEEAQRVVALLRSFDPAAADALRAHLRSGSSKPLADMFLASLEGAPEQARADAKSAWTSRPGWVFALIVIALGVPRLFRDRDPPPNPSDVARGAPQLNAPVGVPDPPEYRAEATALDRAADDWTQQHSELVTRLCDTGSCDYVNGLARALVRHDCDSADLALRRIRSYREPTAASWTAYKDLQAVVAASCAQGETETE